LTAANALSKRGFAVTLVEKSARLGGKLRTDETAGFALDRGFQVYFPSYPNASSILDHSSLNLRYWPNGAKFFADGRWHTIDARMPFTTALSPLFPLVDKLRTLRLNAWSRDENFIAQQTTPDVSAEVLLRRLGFSESYLDRFARPFFGGIFLDRTLSVSARQFLFIWGMVSRGGAAIPAREIESIPRQIADQSPDVRFLIDTEATHIGTQAVRVRGGEIPADVVILAVGYSALPRFLPDISPISSRASFCFHFRIPKPLGLGPYLQLQAGSSAPDNPGPWINEVAPVTEISPELAAFGGQAISVTSLRPDANESEIRTELAMMYPGYPWHRAELLRIDPIWDAQFAQPPGRTPLSLNLAGRPNLFVTGEFTENCSIDGAIQSGLKCAGEVARRSQP